MAIRIICTLACFLFLSGKANRIAATYREPGPGCLHIQAAKTGDSQIGIAHSRLEIKALLKKKKAKGRELAPAVITDTPGRFLAHKRSVTITHSNGGHSALAGQIRDRAPPRE